MRKFTSSLLQMSKRKSVENQKDGKRGKKTSFFIPKVRTEIGKFMKSRLKSAYITTCRPISCSRRCQAMVSDRLIAINTINNNQ